ncbi:MAG: hypothetical protein KKG76_01350 [Euryarchaeota archaeon]|nr:hypothetical protein [Euryarchaeota archaeon]
MQNEGGVLAQEGMVSARKGGGGITYLTLQILNSWRRYLTEKSFRSESHAKNLNELRTFIHTSRAGASPDPTEAPLSGGGADLAQRGGRASATWKGGRNNIYHILIIQLVAPIGRRNNSHSMIPDRIHRIDRIIIT